MRDQHHNKHHVGSHSQEPHYDREVLFVNIGELVNLTCRINTKEIDWHFKDKNLTTTILSYGLQLQVAQPNLDFSEYSASSSSSHVRYDQNYDYESEQNFRGPNVATPLVKYKLSSDRQNVHMLTLYVQGPQDEGSYQCIDSKSESPIKKSILVYLSKKMLFF